MTVATSELNSDKETLFPDTVSGSKKSGAVVPSASIFEGVTAIEFLILVYCKYTEYTKKLIGNSCRKNYYYL